MAVKKKVVMQEELPVVDLIKQILEEGKDLTTKTDEKEAKEKIIREEWIKRNNEASIAAAKKWEAKIALAKQKEIKASAKIKDVDKIEQERIHILEQKRKEEIVKNNALYEERAKKQVRLTNIARVKSAMRDRKVILSKESWEKESQKWQKLLDQVSR
ncbi:hypothetical protein S100390_v1c04330 [Spiroplasma sp. NBRC 100390]|uniref:hypothetical protein n=1 Tax=unclassified Spiroplasma TaxID=2637901 RepID=UPI000892908B|nr:MULTISPECIES: hypothetical protein [unclassified Spiroplasma]AOX43776.1 hypothetical protein STU14_v1c04330 [Spiroplasma sp. TU-14]APE13246.1 hypothetical protein S100390_v1c04330 [Spiroplasma sp. NBRC 100390]